MKKRTKALICITIILIISACLLAACGEDDGGPVSEYVYMPKYIDLPKEITDISTTFFDGKDTIYFSTYAKTGEIEPAEGDPQPGSADYYEGMYDTYGYSLCKMKTDGTGFARLENYQLATSVEGKEADVYLQNITVDKEGNLWVLESASAYHWEGDIYMSDGQSYLLRKLDTTGAEISSIDISKLGEGKEYFYIQNFLIGVDGYIYLSDGENAIYVLSADGNKDFELPLDNYSYNMITLADGTTAILSYGNNGQELKTVDTAGKKWGTTVPLPYNINTLYAGSGEYDFYYTDSSNFCGYNIKKQSGEQLVNWVDADISGDPSFVIPLSDQQILCGLYSYSYSGESKYELAMLTKTPRSEMPEREIITLACLYPDQSIRVGVVNFNKTNQEYRIQLKDYSSYNTEEDYSAGLTKLNTEIISGKIPDILLTSQLPIKQYAAKGLVEDLTPYIENDTDLGGMDAFITDVFDASRVGDMLPAVTSNFGILSVLGASRIVGEEPGWTIDELNAALATMPEGCTAFGPNMDKNSLLQYICAMNIDDYVDWSTATCSFDNEEFIKLLEFCKTAPEPLDWENIDWETYYQEEYIDDQTLIREGKMMLSLMNIYSFDDMPYYVSSFNEPVTFIGFPSRTSIGSVFYVENGLAISSKSAHKDAAWQFVRTILTEEYQEEHIWWGLPTNKAVFEQKAADALKTDDESSGGSVIVDRAYAGGPEEYNMPEITQKDIDAINSLISKIDHTANYDQSIIDIIMEEAAPFFAGKKTAEATAKVIQSRIGTYVSEQS